MMSMHSNILFVYEDDRDSQNGRKTAERIKPLTPEAPAGLPDDVVSEFQWASETTDYNVAMRLIDHIRAENEPLADALTELVSTFRFDILQELFEKGE